MEANFWTELGILTVIILGFVLWLCYVNRNPELRKMYADMADEMDDFLGT